MPKVVHKYEVNGVPVQMPVGAEIISIGFQMSWNVYRWEPTLYAWAIFDVNETRMELRDLKTYVTGDPSIPPDAQHIGTAMTSSDDFNLVLHVFESGRIVN